MKLRKLPVNAGKIVLKALVPIVSWAFPRTDRMRALQAKKSPKRILLLNGFHIGDIVIATSVIPILRAAYPDAEIGFATGSWSQMVVKKHPELTYTHTIDHWILNRGPLSFFEKMLRYRKSRRTALREVRKVDYDIAICLVTNFPDFLDIAWAAKIPVRIGFSRSVFSALATDLVEEPESPFVHQGERLAAPLRALPIDPKLFSLRQSTLPPSDLTAILEVSSLLQVARLEEVRFSVVHMGSGAERREMSCAFWRELAEKLSTDSILLFTGRGPREAENINSAIGGISNCINACDRLSWDGFVAAVRFAESLYGVESMAGHVAGAVGTRCYVVYGGTAGVAQWRPEGNGSIVFTNHVPCAPCLQAKGCTDMTCMQHISPSDLVRFVPHRTER